MAVIHLSFFYFLLRVEMDEEKENSKFKPVKLRLGVGKYGWV